VALSYNNARRDLTNRDMRPQGNGFVAFEFLPRLTLTARGSAAGPPRYLSDTESILRDISAGAQFLALRETGTRPAIALGATDMGGAAPNFESRYIVATKTFADRVRLTGGYGADGHLLSGAFGGASVGICDWLTVIGENDARQSSFGVRLTPFAATAARYGVMPAVDIVSRGETGTVTNFTLRFGLPATPRTTATTPAVRPGNAARRSPSATRSVESLARSLVDLGLENVSVAVVSGGLLEVGYENWVWVYEEASAIGAVLAAVQQHAPAAVTEVRLLVRRHEATVLALGVRLADWAAFTAGQREGGAFAESLRIEGGRDAAARSPIPPARWLNRARARLDVTVVPRLESTLLTEVGIADSRVAALPEATLRLGRGLMLTGRRSIKLYRSVGFPDSIRVANADRLLVQLARPLDLGVFPAGTSGFAQASLGRFGHGEVGGSVEADFALPNGRINVGFMGAAFGRAFGKINRSVALGNIRVRTPRMGTTVSLTAGHFMHGDIGALGEVARWFGPMEVGFFVRASEFSQAAGARVRLPLSPSRTMRPRTVRVNAPEAIEVSQQSVILEDINALRSDIAIPLRTGNELFSAVWQRDRLSAGQLRAQVELMRAQALR